MSATASLTVHVCLLHSQAGNKTLWGCNAIQNPTTEDTLYDGTFVGPLEVMFVKMKASFANEEFASSTAAYQRWMEERGGPLGTTRYQHASSITLAAIEQAKRLEDCFDAAYYALENGLGPGAGDRLRSKRLFNHFVHVGQFLGYAWRAHSTCDV